MKAETQTNESTILPASGDAVEDPQHPDQDEIEETIINKEMNSIPEFAQIPEPDPRDIYHSASPLPRSENQLFDAITAQVWCLGEGEIEQINLGLKELMV